MSVQIPTPPGGRSAPGGETPPGGDTPPGGRSAPGGEGAPQAPLGRPPRVRLRPLSRHGGKSKTVTQIVKIQPDRAKQLREAISKRFDSRKERPDLHQGTPQNVTPNQASTMRTRGLGRKMPQPRTRVSQAGAEAAAAAAGKTEAPKQAASDTTAKKARPKEVTEHHEETRRQVDEELRKLREEK